MEPGDWQGAQYLFPRVLGRPGLQKYCCEDRVFTVSSHIVIQLQRRLRGFKNFVAVVDELGFLCGKILSVHSDEDGGTFT